jgi:hypothetical protein
MITISNNQKTFWNSHDPIEFFGSSISRGDKLQPSLSHAVPRICESQTLTYTGGYQCRSGVFYSLTCAME